MQILCPSTNSYETCASLKIKGHLVSFRAVNCPVPHSIIIIRGDIIHSYVYLSSIRRESKEYHRFQFFKLVHFSGRFSDLDKRNCQEDILQHTGIGRQGVREALQELTDVKRKVTGGWRVD